MQVNVLTIILYRGILPRLELVLVAAELTHDDGQSEAQCEALLENILI